MSQPAEHDWVRAMRSGDYQTAWELSEATLAARDPRTRDDPSLPYHLRWVWDGRPFDGKHVLVRCYHGLGDTIQFARYLPRLRARAASLTLEAPERLIPLLSTVDGVDRLVPFDHAHPLPPSECDMEIMDLAFALREPPGNLRPPYLQCDRAALPAGTLGLCLEAGDWDRERCVPAHLFDALCRNHRVITLASTPIDLPVLNAGGCPHDMEVTASLVAGVDLVITVDTMIAHLAGAMNRPTWLLLKAEPDWRWSPAEERSAWYPSTRIYAQPAPGDWATVVGRVAQDLATYDFELNSPKGARCTA